MVQWMRWEALHALKSTSVQLEGKCQSDSSPSGAGSFTAEPFSARDLASSCKLSRRSAARLRLICSSSSTCVYKKE